MLTSIIRIAEKAVWRSVFLTIQRCISNADSTKIYSSGAILWRFCRLPNLFYSFVFLVSESLSESTEMKCLLRYLNQPTNLEEVLSIQVLNDDPAVKGMIERSVLVRSNSVCIAVC